VDGPHHARVKARRAASRQKGSVDPLDMDAAVLQRLGYVRDLSPNAAYDVIPSQDRLQGWTVNSGHVPVEDGVQPR
jgi:hypothetical protein